MSDTGRQLEHMKALASTSPVTFKTLTKDGTAEKHKFYPILWEHFAPNKTLQVHKIDSPKKQIKDSLAVWKWRGTLVKQ